MLLDGGLRLPFQYARAMRPPSSRRVTKNGFGVRCFDITLLLMLAPFLLVCSALIVLAIFIDSPGPVIYRARRIGRNGEPFEMLKFRKMRRDAVGGPLTLVDDDRFTPIGRFLAATRFDELPQFVNVLRGEMSVVGPRPEEECFVADFRDEYDEILKVAPGITGRAQLRFLNERVLLAQAEDPLETYRSKLLPDKVGIDLHYARTRSLTGDVLILARTMTTPVTGMYSIWGEANRSRVCDFQPVPPSSPVIRSGCASAS